MLKRTMVLFAIGLAMAALYWASPFGGGNYFAPTADPNERNLIAVSYKDWWGTHQIFLVSIDGRRRSQLTRHSFDCTHPAWSPDGTRIAYVGYGDGQIRVMAADGAEDRPLTDYKPNAIRTTPRWAPDGAHIYFTAGARNSPDLIEWPNTHIWIMRADGADQRQLTFGDFGDLAPTPSPDGASIIFASNRESGTYHLWRMASDGGEPKRLTGPERHPTLNLPVEQKMPAWSPDGRHIAYWNGVEMSHLTREVLLSGGKVPPGERDLQIARTWQIWLMDADGGGQRALTSGDDPAWSPDSTRVMFPATYEPQHGVGSAPIDGTKARMLFYVGYSGGPSGFSWRPTQGRSAP